MSRDFEIVETRGDSWVHIRLSGDFDYPAAHALDGRLNALRAESLPVRLNLSAVTFIDSRGMSAVLRAVEESRRSGWQFEVDADVAPLVRSRFNYVGLGHILTRRVA